jgi:hypothetical protein
MNRPWHSARMSRCVVGIAVCVHDDGAIVPLLARAGLLLISTVLGVHMYYVQICLCNS